MDKLIRLPSRVTRDTFGNLSILKNKLYISCKRGLRSLMERLSVLIYTVCAYSV